jgi:CBS domain-containing protein
MENSNIHICSRKRPFLTACHRFLVGTGGHSAIEYAFLLALIVCSVMVTGGMFSQASNRISVLGDNGFGTGIASDTNPAEKLHPEPQAKITTLVETVGWALPVGILALVLTCLAYGVYVVTKSKKQDVSKETETPGEAVATNPLFLKRQNILRIISADMQVLLESRLEVRHLMSKRLTTVGPRDSFKAILETMTTQKLRHLLVCEKEKLVGIISDRDLHKPNAQTAADLMTRNPYCVEPESAIVPAITQLMNKRISCLPVTSDGELVGVLTTTDLMMALQCTLQVLGKLSAELLGPSDLSHVMPKGGKGPEPVGHPSVDNDCELTYTCKMDV